MTGPPKRHSSMEMTAVIPRDKLPPISKSDVAALDLDPEHPETHELMARAQEGTGDRETLVQCPACKSCPCCQQGGMTTFSRASEWEHRQANLAGVDDPG